MSRLLTVSAWITKRITPYLLTHCSNDHREVSSRLEEMERQERVAAMAICIPQHKCDQGQESNDDGGNYVRAIPGCKT